MKFSSFGVFCLSALCVPCKSDRIRVKGLINGNEITLYPQQKQSLAYDEGQILNLTCEDFAGFDVSWSQQKNDITLFSQNKQDASSHVNIEMKLYKFDNNSTLSCISADDFKTTVRISLKLNNEYSPQKDQIYDNESKSVYIGETVKTQCEFNNFAKMYAALSDNSIVATNESYEFNVNKEHDGIVFFCIYMESLKEGSFKKIRKNVVLQNYTQYAPNPIEFVEGQVLNYKCELRVEDSDIGLQWIQQKYDTTLFNGSQYDMYARINMTLFKFDNGSTLSCIAYDKYNYKEKYKVNIPIYLKKNSTPSAPVCVPVQEKYLEKDDNFTMTCKNNSTDTYLDIYYVLPGNGIVKNSKSNSTKNKSYTFYITKYSFGLEFFCIKIVGSKHSDERIIINHIKILQKGSFVSYEVFVLIAMAVGAIIVAIILTIIICKVKRKRVGVSVNFQNMNAQRNQVPENVYEPSETVYAEPRQVIYAELQLHENAQKKNAKQAEEQYAEIIHK